MIARLTQPAHVHELRGFIAGALRTHPHVERPELALDELEQRAADNTMGIYVGAVERELAALLIVEAATSEFSRAVCVVHIYNTGGIALLRGLFRCMEAFKNEHGLSRVHGIDINQRPRAYCRLFRLGPWRPEPVGMFYQFAER